MSRERLGSVGQVELSEAYVTNAYKDGIEEDEDTDVHVRFAATASV